MNYFKYTFSLLEYITQTIRKSMTCFIFSGLNSQSFVYLNSFSPSSLVPKFSSYLCRNYHHPPHLTFSRTSVNVFPFVEPFSPLYSVSPVLCKLIMTYWIWNKTNESILKFSAYTCIAKFFKGCLLLFHRLSFLRLLLCVCSHCSGMHTSILTTQRHEA